MNMVEEFDHDLCQGNFCELIRCLQDGKISLEEATELCVNEYIEEYVKDHRDGLRQCFKDFIEHLKDNEMWN